MTKASPIITQALEGVTTHRVRDDTVSQMFFCLIFHAYSSTQIPSVSLSNLLVPSWFVCLESSRFRGPVRSTEPYRFAFFILGTWLRSWVLSTRPYWFSYSKLLCCYYLALITAAGFIDRREKHGCCNRLQNTDGGRKRRSNKVHIFYVSLGEPDIKQDSGRSRFLY